MSHQIKSKINHIKIKAHLRELNGKDIEIRVNRIINQAIETEQKIKYIKKELIDPEILEVDKRVIISILKDIENNSVIEKESVRNELNGLLYGINQTTLNLSEKEKLRQKLFEKFKFNPNKEDFSDYDFTITDIHIEKTKIENFKQSIEETVRNSDRMILIKQIGFFLIISSMIIGVTLFLRWIIF
jgi:hypothetical protein